MIGLDGTEERLLLLKKMGRSRFDLLTPEPKAAFAGLKVLMELASR